MSELLGDIHAGPDTIFTVLGSMFDLAVCSEIKSKRDVNMDLYSTHYCV